MRRLKPALWHAWQCLAQCCAACLLFALLGGLDHLVTNL